MQNLIFLYFSDIYSLTEYLSPPKGIRILIAPHNTQQQLFKILNQCHAKSDQQHFCVRPKLTLKRRYCLKLIF